MPTSPPPPPGDRPTTFQTRFSPSSAEAVSRRGAPPTDAGQFPRQTAPSCLQRESPLDSDGAAGAEHPYLRLYQYLHQKAPPPAPPVTTPPHLAPEKTPMARPVVVPGPAVPRLDVRDSSPLGPSDSAPSSSTPPPPGPRRANAPSPPSVSPFHKPKTFLATPNSTPPLPSKPPPSPGNRRRPPTSGGNPPPAAPSVAPASLPAAGKDPGQDLPQSHRRKASSPGGHTPTRGMAPPPPSSSPVTCHQEAPRAPPPCRDTSAPPFHVREAPPPPPVRTLGSPHLPSDHPVRVKPPAPPPPPPLRSSSPTCSASSLNADFESRFSFHRVEDFPPPEIFKLLSNVYPSKAQKAMRGAPPLPPVGR